MTNQDPSSASSILDPLQIHLPVFQGPLDLLLHLIQKKKLDIQTVPLAEVCTPFLSYVKKLEKINLENLGQFISIAASLVAIKTRSLLPKKKEEMEEDFDEEESLRIRLVEYEKIKKMTKILINLNWLYSDIFPKGNILIPENLDSKEEEIEVNIPDLFQSYQNILSQLDKKKINFHLPEFRIDSKDIFKKIKNNFESTTSFSLKNVFTLFDYFEEKIISFVLLLEFCRLKWLRIEQKKHLGEIYFFVTNQFANASSQKLLFS